MWSHDQRARGTLHSPERQPPVLTGPAQVLRQAALQVYQLDIREQLAGPIADAGS